MKKNKINRNYDKHEEILARINKAIKNKDKDKLTKIKNKDNKEANKIVFIGQDSPPVATLIFPLPEYQKDFQCAQDGWKYKAVLEDLANEFRNVYKYGQNATAAKHARIWSDKLHELITDRDLKLFE